MQVFFTLFMKKDRKNASSHRPFPCFANIYTNRTPLDLVTIDKHIIDML